jgi:UDP-N-acetylglucosamine--N-acetylmuramyl-(pentapeptide) pyrophosphoryl-undecaprenol N-acetylglucosamine transferase
MEEELVPRAGLALRTIEGGPIVGVPLRQKVKHGAQLLASVLTVERIMSSFRPDTLFMTGGYVNAPVGIVARRRGVPAGIYLPDVEPGTAIKYLSRLVDRVATTTPASAAFFAPGKTVHTGYPVRPELRAAARLEPAAALRLFELEPGRPTLFVFGGSRGARSINRALLAILPELLEMAQVIHISGRLDWEEVDQRARELPPALRPFYRPFPYLHEKMGPAFRAADLVVARAGASMLGESPAFGVPSILVPYPYAWRYQKVNADYLVSQSAAIRLDDERLRDELLPTIRGLLGNEARLARMADAAKALDVPDAAGRLADFIVDLAKGKKG